MKWWNNYDPQQSAINTAKKVAEGKVNAETAMAIAQVHATLAMTEQLERIGDLLEKLVEKR